MQSLDAQGVILPELVVKRRVHDMKASQVRKRGRGLARYPTRIITPARKPHFLPGEGELAQLWEGEIWTK